MADNYLEFSQTLTELTAEEADWLEQQLQPVVVFGDREFAEDDPAIKTMAAYPSYEGPRFLRDHPDFDYQCDERGFECKFTRDVNDGSRNLWLYAECCGSPGYVAWLVQKFFKQFRPSQCWSLTYACTCSKPRVGEFSGGALFVTAAEIKYFSADDFIEQERAAFELEHSDHR
jgi:hypothetical protein